MIACVIAIVPGEAGVIVDTALTSVLREKKQSVPVIGGLLIPGIRESLNATRMPGPDD
jgi:hypothetical protein